jgi:DNA-directed RNA polymerase subunit beta
VNILVSNFRLGNKNLKTKKIMFNTTKDIYRYLLPNLLDIQRSSYCWFLEKGLLEELSNFSVIRDFLGDLELNFATKFYKVKQPKYTLDEAKRRDTTYSIRIFIRAELYYADTPKPQEDSVFLGDIPLMTNEGTFLVNGIERVIINQIVRSPGIYYKSELDKQGYKIYTASLIANRGTWIKFEIDKDDLIYVKIDKAKKFSAYLFLRAVNLENYEIFDGIDNLTYFRLTSSFQELLDKEECLLQVYNKLRPEEPATLKSCQQLLYSKFFDSKRFDLGSVGRH